MKKHSCHHKDSTTSTGLPTGLSWFSILAVAILPKCPFCLMAYSGAVSLCSGNILFPNAGTWASYLTVGLALLVLLSIALNPKGKRTWFALGLASAGIMFLIIGQFLFLSQLNYYLGVLFLFFGIWLNGSFLHYYYKTRALLNQKDLTNHYTK